jgi:hypothetical protein
LHAGQEAPFEPPAADRPARFTGAVGIFRVSASAAPTTVPEGQPILLTVRITAEGKVLSPPGRPVLDQGDEANGRNPFMEDFYIEAADPAAKHPDPATWEFFYLLKPKSTSVKEIPDVPFCYFDPQFGQNPNGYQTRYADAIALTVTPAAPPPTSASRAAPVPDSVLSVVRGEEVLRRQRPWAPPGPGVLAVLLLAPPLACLAWYLVWQRLYPDVARQARRRRSRAARLALQALDSARSLPPEQRADQIAEAVALFLRRRLDLPAATPTPAEAAASLEKAGAPEEIRCQAAAFVTACDTLRFAPDPAPAADDLCAAATALVLAVEGETWSSHPS